MVMAEGTAVLRRNRPGTKAKDFYNWPDESFEEMDSTLAVQQYIQQNIRSDCSNIDKILEPPEGQDEGVWKYEHLRQFCLELNGLAVKLQSECHPDTCTQMTATEQWIFLCAAHKTPKECPAIDYTRHTLDGAACLLNSNKYFPSRVSIKESSVAKLGSVCRRIYRIFSHAYFHHRQIFDKYEVRTGLKFPGFPNRPESGERLDLLTETHRKVSHRKVEGIVISVLLSVMNQDNAPHCGGNVCNSGVFPVGICVQL
uniref:MOB family member 4, phocein n=1 Tax=Esox lucius TaxID=8010 RepID=A0AAY5L2D6_ESOLU